MDFRSPSEKVFAMDELTEIILGFLPGVEMGYEKLLELRTVNKCWRKALLPVLVDNSIHLVLDISSQTSVQDYTKLFPADSCLPMHVKISNEYWRNDQLTFLRDYARVITTISFEKMPGFNEDHSNLECMTTTFPRLEELEVSPSSGCLYPLPTDPWSKIIRLIVKNTKKMQFFRLIVPMDKHEENEITSVPDLPYGLTSVDFRGMYWSNEIYEAFMAADTSKLVYLGIDVLYHDRQEQLIGKLLNKVAGSLEILNIKLWSEEDTDTYPMIIPAASKIRSLEVRTMDLQIAPKSLCQLDDLNIKGPIENVLDNLEQVNRASAKYSKLDTLRIAMTETYEDLEIYEDLVDRATQVLLETIKLCPNLKHFETNFILPDTAAAIFPVMFHHQKLEIFRFELIQLDGQSCDLTYLLTGVPDLEVPKDRAEWSGLLDARDNSISNLRCLDRLKILNQGAEKFHVSQFLFEALSKMSSLKMLNLIGSFQMDKDVAENWLNQNSCRSLIIEDYNKDIQRTYST